MLANSWNNKVCLHYLLLHNKLPQNIVALSNNHVFCSQIWHLRRAHAASSQVCPCSIWCQLSRFPWRKEDLLSRWLIHLARQLVSLVSGEVQLVLWFRFLSSSSHELLLGLFGLLHSGVAGFPGVSILREKGEMHGIFMTIKIMTMKVTKCLFHYVLLDEAVTKGCPRSKREGIDLTSWWGKWQGFRRAYGMGDIAANLGRYNLP